jgi:hypothetical protein
MAKRRKRGFGSPPAEHKRMFLGLLQDAEGHLDSAERVLRGGDCAAGVESTLAAERLYGEARAHYNSRTAQINPQAQARFQHATKRLNFLRHALKKCVG